MIKIKINGKYIHELVTGYDENEKQETIDITSTDDLYGNKDKSND